MHNSVRPSKPTELQQAAARLFLPSHSKLPLLSVLKQKTNSSFWSKTSMLLQHMNHFHLSSTEKNKHLKMFRFFRSRHYILEKNKTTSLNFLITVFSIILRRNNRKSKNVFQCCFFFSFSSCFTKYIYTLCFIRKKKKTKKQ